MIEEPSGQWKHYANYAGILWSIIKTNVLCWDNKGQFYGGGTNHNGAKQPSKPDIAARLVRACYIALISGVTCMHGRS